MRFFVLRKALESIMAIIQSRCSPLFDSHRIAICLCSRPQTFIDYIIIPSVSIHHHVNRSGNSILPPRFDIIKVSNGWHREIRKDIPSANSRLAFVSSSLTMRCAYLSYRCKPCLSCFALSILLDSTRCPIFLMCK